MAVKLSMVVFSVVMLCVLGDGWIEALKMEAIYSSKTLVLTQKSTYHNPEGHSRTYKEASNGLMFL
jgi:hypothetical protein